MPNAKPKPGAEEFLNATVYEFETKAQNGDHRYRRRKYDDGQKFGGTGVEEQKRQQGNDFPNHDEHYRKPQQASPVEVFCSRGYLTATCGRTV